MTGPEQRQAVSVWQRAERERRMVRAVQEAEWRRRMLRAGAIDPAGLSDQALRILAWLAEWDDWTVDGVIELLTAAHHAGREAARGDAGHPTPVSAMKTQLAAVRDQRPADPGVGR